MPAVFVYLHGLNSSGRSRKALDLREWLAPWPVLAPTYPAHRPEQAVAELTAFFAGLAGEPTLLVGSSMGGFYGQYLARRFPVRHLFLINPALQPWALLPPYAGQTMRTADGEDYVLTGAVIEATRRYAVDDPCDGVPTTLFLDRGDEVIDYRIACRLYGACGRLYVFDGGNHAFEHLNEAIAVLREAVNAPDRGPGRPREDPEV